MLRYFSNGIPRSSVSSPLAARITRVRGARPAVFYKDGKTAHHTGSVSHAVRRRPRITCTHSPANDARRRRSADEATKKEGLFFDPPPPASPPPFASSRVRPSLPDRARAQGIKGCATRPGNRCVPLDAPRARTRRMPTRSHAFARTHTNASIHPAHRSPVSTLASHRIASHRVHHRRPASPPPSSRPRSHPRVVTRPPTTPPPTSGQTRVKNTHIEPTFRARTTHRSPRATRRGRRHGRRRRRHRPHHHRPRPRRRRVTSRRHARDRAIDGCSIGFVFWILIGFGVCTLRTCRVVYS